MRTAEGLYGKLRVGLGSLDGARGNGKGVGFGGSEYGVCVSRILGCNCLCLDIGIGLFGFRGLVFGERIFLFSRRFGYVVVWFC